MTPYEYKYMTKENIQLYGIVFIKTLQCTSCLNANLITTVLTGPNIDHRLLLPFRSGSHIQMKTPITTYEC